MHECFLSYIFSLNLKVTIIYKLAGIHFNSFNDICSFKTKPLKIQFLEEKNAHSFCKLYYVKYRTVFDDSL